MRVVSVHADFSTCMQAGIKSILSRMKAVRIVAIAVGAIVVLYLLLIAFIPEWMIVGFRFHLPWSK